MPVHAGAGQAISRQLRAVVDVYDVSEGRDAGLLLLQAVRVRGQPEGRRPRYSQINWRK